MLTTKLKKILSSHSFLGCALVAIASCFAYYFPLLGRVAGSVAANTAPIICGVLIGAVSVLSTMLMVIYPALGERKITLGERYQKLMKSLPGLTTEIRDDTLVSVFLTACVLVLYGSTQIERLSLVDKYYDVVMFLYSDVMIVSGVIMFIAALDVVRCMFSLFSIVHVIFSYEKDQN